MNVYDLKDSRGRRLLFRQGPAYAAIDRSILNRWAVRSVDTATSSLRMCDNNNWDRSLNEEEFVKLANSLGYWRLGEIPEWMYGRDEEE